jgi:hypothetical protein
MHLQSITGSDKIVDPKKYKHFGLLMVKFLIKLQQFDFLEKMLLINKKSTSSKHLVKLECSIQLTLSNNQISTFHTSFKKVKFLPPDLRTYSRNQEYLGCQVLRNPQV